MINMFNVWIIYIWSPYLIPLIGAVLQALLLIGLILFPTSEPPKNIKSRFVFYCVKNVMKYLYGFFGMMLLEMAIVWLLGPWGYADWRYQLPKFIIGLIIGIEFVWGYLSQGKVYDYILLIISTVLYVLFLTVYLPSIYNFRPHFGEFVWIIVGGIIIVILYSIMDHKRFQDQNEYISRGFDRIFSNKVKVGLFILAAIDSFLLFYGYSLFSW